MARHRPRKFNKPTSSACPIRRILETVTTTDAAAATRILYGGSVKPDNVDELMACPNVDGALVGGASLKADDFLRIVNFEER